LAFARTGRAKDDRGPFAHAATIARERHRTKRGTAHKRDLRQERREKSPSRRQGTGRRGGRSEARMGVVPSPSLTLFAHVAGRPDAEIDLAEASLLIAEAEYPGLEVARYIGMLDELGRAATLLLKEKSDRPSIERVLRFLYEDEKFRGNTDDYYDPKNS